MRAQHSHEEDMLVFQFYLACSGHDDSEYVSNRSVANNLPLFTFPDMLAHNQDRLMEPWVTQRMIL